MKNNMNEYTIPCTEEQTKKALELGAPIYTSPYFHILKYEVRNFFVKDDTCYYFPTAEQMIGWLEEQGVIIEVCRYEYRIGWTYFLSDVQASGLTDFQSRNEATLAAIDAALEYLSNNKKHD